MTIHLRTYWHAFHAAYSARMDAIDDRVTDVLVSWCVNANRWLEERMQAIGPMSKDNSPKLDAGLLAIDPTALRRRAPLAEALPPIALSSRCRRVGGPL